MKSQQIQQSHHRQNIESLSGYMLLFTRIHVWLHPLTQLIHWYTRMPTLTCNCPDWDLCTIVQSVIFLSAALTTKSCFLPAFLICNYLTYLGLFFKEKTITLSTICINKRAHITAGQIQGLMWTKSLWILMLYLFYHILQLTDWQRALGYREPSVCSLGKSCSYIALSIYIHMVKQYQERTHF